MESAILLSLYAKTMLLMLHAINVRTTVFSSKAIAFLSISLPMLSISNLIKITNMQVWSANKDNTYKMGSVSLLESNARNLC
jgi:hypothetical protein